jgi:DNA topoisomerase III
MTNSSPTTVLNVAEKPSVARALAAVFARMPGATDGGMIRDAHQIFTHENVCFPNVYAQGEGRSVHGPGTKNDKCKVSKRPDQKNAKY